MVARALNVLYEPAIAYKNDKFTSRSTLNDEEWIAMLASESEWIIVGDRVRV